MFHPREKPAACGTSQHGGSHCSLLLFTAPLLVPSVLQPRGGVLYRCLLRRGPNGLLRRVRRVEAGAVQRLPPAVLQPMP